jgi:hypothetical protein
MVEKYALRKSRAGRFDAGKKNQRRRVFKKEQCKLAKGDHCDAETKWQVSNVAACARFCRPPGSAAHHDAGI